MNNEEIKTIANQFCSVIMDYGKCEHYHNDDEKVHTDCIKKHAKLIVDFYESNEGL